MKFRFLASAVLFFCAAGYARGSETLTGFEYRWGDSPQKDGVFEWAASNTSGWLPQTDRLQDIREDQKIVWQRVRLPDLSFRDPVVYIEIVFDETEVFLDGKKIYSYGSVDNYKPFWRSPSIWYHVIQLPENFQGKYLYFRSRSESAGIGIDRAIKIGNRADIQKSNASSDLDVFILGFVFLFIGVFSLFMFFSRFGENAFFSFGFYLLASGVYTIVRTETLHFLWPNPSFWIWVWFGSLYTMPIWAFVYFEDILGNRFSRYLRFAWQIHILIGIVSLSLPAFGLIPLFELLAPFQYMVLVDLIVLVGIPAYAAYGRDTDARLIIIGYAILTIFFVHDILKDQGYIKYDQTLNHWGFFIFIIFLSLILLRRYRNVQVRLETYSRELEDKNVKLSRLDRMKDEFLADTSHELKTPLHGMIGIAESLLEARSDRLSSDLKKNLGLIVQSGRRLSGLVSDILEYSRLKNESPSLSLRPIRLKSAVGAAFEIVRPLIRNKSVVLINEVEESLPPVRADENRLQQIFLNLLANALKFTDSGTIRVTAVESAGFVEVTVKDTGSGIPEEFLETVFRPFETGPPGKGGTGLGLSIARQLVRLHGGEIQARKESAPGASLSFTIPVWTENLAEEPGRNGAHHDIAGESPDRRKAFHPEEDLSDKPARLDGPPDRPRVLIVDDEPVNLQILKNRLQHQGYVVVSADTGLQALDEIAVARYDLVLLDIMMPGLSGFEVCRRIRQRYSLHELPILFLSARGTTEDLIAGFEAGGNDYVIKPFNGTELAARVNTLLTLRLAVREERKHLVLKHEMETARRIQLSLLPDSYPKVEGFNFTLRYRPTAPVGGDFFDYLESENGIGFILADVTGHGIPAALIAAMVKIAFSVQKGSLGNPSQVLSEMNEILCGKTRNHYITAAYLYYDFTSRTLRYASAGHPPMIVLRSDGHVESFKPKGTILACFNGRTFEACDFLMNPGDRLLVFTDGMIESRNNLGEMYGEEKFMQFLEENRGLKIGAFADRILNEFEGWVDEDPDDDFALFVLDA